MISTRVLNPINATGIEASRVRYSKRKCSEGTSSTPQIDISPAKTKTLVDGNIGQEDKFAHMAKENSHRSLLMKAFSMICGQCEIDIRGNTNDELNSPIMILPGFSPRLHLTTKASRWVYSRSKDIDKATITTLIISTFKSQTL